MLKELLEELNDHLKIFSLNPILVQTHSLWSNFIEFRINTSRGNKNTITNLLVKFVNLTEEFCKLVKDKEIITWTTNEVNLKILNADISPYQRLEIKIFLDSISKKFDVNYKPEKFLDIYEIIEKLKVKREKQSYNINEFIMLLNYTSNVELHKKEALQYMRRPLGRNTKYREYQSVWLYVLVHLNNAWRSNDVITKIPRITLPSSISNLKDYEKHELTGDEIDIVIWELTAKIIGTQHAKNRKDAYYFFSDELKEALANAIVLCELKCQIERPLSNNLIKLSDNNQLLDSMHNQFFKNFEIENFSFKSLAANRSYITFVNMVLKKKTNRNPMEISKLIRGHSSQDTTNIYIQISDEHLNRISREIFNKGYFGYTYEFLLKSIVDFGTSEKSLNINEIDFVKTVFGDIYRIENFANYINHLERNSLSLYEYMEKLSLSERNELLCLISLEQLPAKKKFWQCILGNCLYLNRECDACPFAIPNIYSLIKVVENLEKYLTQYENMLINNTLLGERKRITNLIFRNLNILGAAKRNFGENIIEAFLGYDYSLFKKRISNLEDFYNYLTIERN